MSNKVSKHELDVAREFGKIFEYKYDAKVTKKSWGRLLDGLLDTWSILPLSQDGKYYGDCEDFSLTVLYLIKGSRLRKFLWSLITGEAKMYYVKTRNGGGHAVMQYKDKYIDNWSRKFTTKKQMEKFGHDFKYHVWFPFVFLNLIKGKIITTIRRILGV